MQYLNHVSEYFDDHMGLILEAPHIDTVKQLIEALNVKLGLATRISFSNSNIERCSCKSHKNISSDILQNRHEKVIELNLLIKNEI